MYLNNLCKFVKYFAFQRKRELVIYVIMSYFASILEVFGVAIVYPFILILLKPDFSEKFSFCISPLLLGVGILVLFVLKNIYMVYCIKIQSYIAKGIETDIIKKFMEFFICGSYLTTSSVSRVNKERYLSNLTEESVNNFFIRFLNLNINLAIIISILLLLFIKFPLPAMLTMFFAAVIISGQNIVCKKLIKKVSQSQWSARREFDLLKGEILPNIKLIKISGNKNKLLKTTGVVLNKLKIAESEFYSLNSAQPYILEPLIIILLFIMLGSIAYTSKYDSSVMIASFAIVASAIFRILPALSRVQVSLNGIARGRNYVGELIDFFESYGMQNCTEISKEEVIFNNQIILKNVSFCYKIDKIILKNINLEINKNTYIGVIGASGAGKTTLIDIISGLLTPVSGEIYLDGEEITSLSSIIGYVPQEPIFLDTSFRENIAFGADIIDDNRVIELLQKTGLYNFVFDNYSDNIYASPMTDSIGLSLGQKQRLSIARALYRDPQILILDEATSSLDLQTEQEICGLFDKLKTGITIVAVAHRLSALVNCDKLVYLKDGKILAEGTFKSLEENCSEFTKMIEIQKLNSHID